MKGRKQKGKRKEERKQERDEEKARDENRLVREAEEAEMEAGAREQ